MASQGGTSRLTQIQMRFQQRQQQEREQRKTEMSGGKLTTEAAEVKTLNSSIGAGKVRQMFDERRQRSTGIDKSYPLKPISSSGITTANTTTRTTTIRKQVSSQVSKKITRDTMIEKKTRAVNGTFLSPTYPKSIEQNNITNENNANVNYNTHSSSNSTIPMKLSDVRTSDERKKLDSYAEEDKNNNNNNRQLNNTAIKLKPIVTKKTVHPEQITAKKADTGNSSSGSVQKFLSPNLEKARPTTGTLKTNVKANAHSTPRKPVNYIKEKSPADSLPDNMAACRICNRNFNIDRIEKHQEICEKTAAKKRKVFDASKHRVKGTEAEQFVRKALRTSSAKAAPTKTNDATVNKKNNWRKKHEEFIQAIRAAKEMQEHLAKGGKLSDLPPPPPSENPDYIQCPHCKRRFNEAAAERHIPKCANMLHNKPKPVKKAPTRR